MLKANIQGATAIVIKKRRKKNHININIILEVLPKIKAGRLKKRKNKISIIMIKNQGAIVKIIVLEGDHRSANNKKTGNVNLHHHLKNLRKINSYNHLDKRFNNSNLPIY